MNEEFKPDKKIINKERKEILKITKILKRIDKDIIIISEKAKTINNIV